ncbi:unnamed protein product [Closterium sp. Naga37s-1]|nr:unnamed protein product [Closterium sp. Naga37s-1]
MWKCAAWGWAGATQENEAADEEEEHEPVPEQAGENPDVLEGAEEGGSEPTHEPADSYEEAEEEEGGARRESRRDDPDRQEGCRASDAQQQEQLSQADDMRELQVRDLAGEKRPSAHRRQTGNAAEQSSAAYGRRGKGAGPIGRRRAEEGGARNPARQSRKDSNGESRALRASRDGGTSGPARSLTRPFEATGVKEGWAKRGSHRTAIGGTEGAERDGRHRRRGAKRTGRGEKEERGADARRQR